MSSLGRGRGYAGRRLAAGDSRPGDSRIVGPGASMGTPRPGDYEAIEDPELIALLHIDEVYRPILDQLERLTPGEDGIALNRKLNEIESTIASCVSTQAQMCDAFRSIRAFCLHDEKTALKCSSAMSVSSLSRTIPLKNTPDKTMRNYYLNVMEETFGKLDVLERSDPQYLINAAMMLSCFYGEARLADGSTLQMLAYPLLGYLETLLHSDSHKAHACLASQLMLNGRRLLSAEQAKMENLCVDVHVRILRSLKGEIIVSVESAPWLLLAADLCVNRFMPLPTKLQHFHAATLKLGVTSDVINATENQSNNDPCIEISYGSWKNDVQNTNKSEADVFANDHDGSLGIQDNSINSTENTCSASNASVSSSVDSQSGARKLRPILGAGARLIKARGSVPDHVAMPSENVFNAPDSTPSYYLSSEHVNAKPPESVYKQPEPPKTKPLNEHSPIFQPSNDVSNYQWKSASTNEDSFKQNTESIIKQANDINLEFKPHQDNHQFIDPSAMQDPKVYLAKRLDLNSWRQGGDNYQDNMGQAFQNKPAGGFEQKKDNWRKTDRNGGSGKEHGTNWRRQSWGDEDARDSDAPDPAVEPSNLGSTKFSTKRNPKENGRWEKSCPDGNRWDGSSSDASGWRDRGPPNDAGRWEKSTDSPKSRTVLSVPRNSKYWDHDDRLERDYDE